MHSIRITLGMALVLCLVAAPFAFADDDRNNSGKGKGNEKKDDKKSFVLPFSMMGTTTGALQAQIQNLQEMLKNLKAQREALDDDSDDDSNNDDDSDNTNKAAREALKSEIKQTKNELKFLRSLSRGMRGDDVRDLQELLAQDPSILDSSNVTGFFGPLTEEALRKFQRKHGIDAIGVFGPKTQAKILALFVGKPLPPGIIARLGLETSSTTPGQGFVTLCHKPSGSTPQTLVIAIPALGAHLAHGDTVGVCAGSGATTTPPTGDTTAPSISTLSVTPASTTASVSWTTNESASSRVWYGTSASLTLGSPTASVFNSALTLTHSLTLSGLSASTTYYIVAESKDAAGNTATSSSVSFVTTN